MSFDSFVREGMREYLIQRERWGVGVRVGQVYSDLLAVTRPGISSLITGSAYDPFYDNIYLHDFLRIAEVLWDILDEDRDK